MRIVLKAAHTHAGVDYVDGDEIDIPDGSALWLIELGRAQEVTDEASDDAAEQSSESEGTENA